MNPGDVSTIRLCLLYPYLRVATLLDSIYTEKSMIMQRVINLSFTSHFSSFELWSFYLDHSELGIMFSGITTITVEASIAVCQLCQLVPARVLE